MMAAIPMTMKSEMAPAVRRPARLMLSWFKVSSNQPITRPIHVTGWPIACTSQSGSPTMASISRARNASVTNMESSLLHGGDLGAARRLFPRAPEPFIDLSTGINPQSYPVPQLSSDVFARLPEPAALDRLAAAAATAYGAPSRDHVVPAPGTQILLPAV